MRSGENWLAERRKYVTGTDVGIILGLNEYCSRRMLVSQKAGRHETPDNDYMLFGRKCEDMAADSYFRWMQLDSSINWVCEEGEFTVSDDGMCAGTPDDMLFAEGNYLDSTVPWMREFNGRMPIEYKTRSYPTIGSALPYTDEELPLKYWLQLQHYMYITKSTCGAMHVWTVCGGRTTFIYKFMAEFYEKTILPQISKFYTGVMLKLPECIDDDSKYVELLKSQTFGRGEKSKMEEIVSKQKTESLIYKNENINLSCVYCYILLLLIIY